ncbi:MAG: TIGR03009 domain-containing protein [Gemmataceae bacterium]
MRKSSRLLALAALTTTLGMAAAQAPNGAPMNLVPIVQTAPGAAPVAGLAPIVPGAGQVPAPQAPLPPALVAHLNAWEAKHKTMTSLYTDVEMVRRDIVADKKKSYGGLLMCMKPTMARLDIKLKTDPNQWQIYMCTGPNLYQYDSVEKTVTDHKLPQGGNGVQGNLLLEFMSGAMTAADVERRFDLRLAREEEFYIHIEVKPRLRRDKEEFESMMLILFSSKATGREYLPKIVVIRTQNGQTDETWTFSDNPKINNPGLKASEFKYIVPPPGWQKKDGGAQNLAPRK